MIRRFLSWAHRTWEGFRSIVVSVPLLVIICLISLWGLSPERPWPLVVVHGDLFSWLGSRVWLFGLSSFLFNFFSLLGCYLAASFFSSFKQTVGGSWRKGPILFCFLTVTVVIGGIAAYPELKAYYSARDLSGTGEADTYVLLIDRSALYPEGNRWRGLVMSSDTDLSLDSLPRAWPFSFLRPGSTRLEYLNSHDLDAAVRAFSQSNFMEFPEQIDPRPSLNHGELYLAVYKKGTLKRTFCRVSDPGFEELDRIVEDILGERGLDLLWTLGTA